MTKPLICNVYMYSKYTFDMYSNICVLCKCAGPEIKPRFLDSLGPGELKVNVSCLHV